MKHRRRPLVLLVTLALVAAVVALPGCDELDIDWDNMKVQPKYEPYAPSAVLKNGTSSQYPVQGTVPRSAADPDAPPPKVTLALIQRGQQRFDIYCAVCHGRDGYGDGMVVQRGFPQPPSLHLQRLRDAPDAYIEHIIVHGLGKMPSYRYEIKPADRAAVVAYVRALQLSQHATIDDVPGNERGKLTMNAGGEGGAHDRR